MASDSLKSKEKKFVKFCLVAFVVYEIYSLFKSTIPSKNVQKLFFFKFFAHKKKVNDIFDGFLHVF